MKQSNQGTFNIFAIISFIVSGVMIYLGYDKVTNYYYSELYDLLNKNAYVGGDAYNYIINGNYATGYYVLALLFAVIGIGLIIIGYLDAIKSIHINSIVSEIDKVQNIEAVASDDEATNKIENTNNDGLKYGRTKTFTVNPEDSPCKFSIEYNGVSEKIIKITEETDTSITIKFEGDTNTAFKCFGKTIDIIGINESDGVEVFRKTLKLMSLI